MVKNLPAKAGDARDGGSVPGVGRSLGEGNGNPTPVLLSRRAYGQTAWWATVHGGHKESDVTEHTSRAGEVGRSTV